MDVLMTLKESLIWVCMSNIECVPIVIESINNAVRCGSHPVLNTLLGKLIDHHMNLLVHI